MSMFIPEKCGFVAARKFLVGFFLAVLPIIASAGEGGPSLPPAPFKPEVGMTLTWKDLDTGKTTVQVLTGVDNFKVSDTWGDRKRTYYILCQYCSSKNMKIDEAAYAKLWPLKVGNSVTVERSVPGKWWTNKIAVVGTERLKLPFGVIDTYRVIDESTARLYNWNGIREYWYAPSIGFSVKSKYSTSEAKSGQWEVIEVKKP